MPLSVAWQERVALIVWAGVIFGFSSIPRLGSGLPQEEALRTVAHASEYAVFSVLCWRVLFRQLRLLPLSVRTAHAFAAAWLLSVAYALSDEVHQRFVAGRSGSITDVVVDAVGAGVGLVLVFALFKARRAREIIAPRARA